MWFIIGIIVVAIVISGIAWLWINHPPKEKGNFTSNDSSSRGYYYYTPLGDPTGVHPNSIFNPGNPGNPAYNDHNLFKNND